MKSKAANKLSNFPYFSQLDNRYKPLVTCNVTSVAKCLFYHGIRGNGIGQLEDQLYLKLSENGLAETDHTSLRWLINTYRRHGGIYSDLRDNGTLQDIREAIDRGNPVILAGYWTRGGHIVVCSGYDDKGFIIQDPFGEWFTSGYRNDLSGKDNHHSIGLISRVCSPESASNPRHILMHEVYGNGGTEYIGR